MFRFICRETSTEMNLILILWLDCLNGSHENKSTEPLNSLFKHWLKEEQIFEEQIRKAERVSTALYLNLC